MDDKVEGQLENFKDFNFIVINGGRTIYDITTGIMYYYHKVADSEPYVSIYRIGSAPIRATEPIVHGDDAVDFWAQLSERIDLNNS